MTSAHQLGVTLRAWSSTSAVSASMFAKGLVRVRSSCTSPDLVAASTAVRALARAAAATAVSGEDSLTHSGDTPACRAAGDSGSMSGY